MLLGQQPKMEWAAGYRNLALYGQYYIARQLGCRVCIRSHFQNSSSWCLELSCIIYIYTTCIITPNWHKYIIVYLYMHKPQCMAVLYIAKLQCRVRFTEGVGAFRWTKKSCKNSYRAYTFHKVMHL